jgi:hypothetical protein
MKSRRSHHSVRRWSACAGIALALGAATVTADTASIATHPIIVANDILNRWEPIAASAGVHSPSWREMFMTQLMLLDPSALGSVARVAPIADADANASYGRFAEAIRSAQMRAFELTHTEKGTIKLGSATTDQVFLPIVPCRIVDTRNVGGPISAGTTRNFYFYAAPSYDWSIQGGAGGLAQSACPLTVNPAGLLVAPSAAVMTITVVSPSAAGNWIVWGGADPVPTISALNWNPGDISANTLVVTGGARGGTGSGGTLKDFAVRYNGAAGSAHFVADVVGYLVENAATPVQCSETAATSTTIFYYGPGAIDSPFCQTGYSVTSGRCESTGHNIVRVEKSYSVGSNRWHCGFQNLDVYNTYTISATAICCRVPGR